MVKSKAGERISATATGISALYLATHVGGPEPRLISGPEGLGGGALMFPN